MRLMQCNMMCKPLLCQLIFADCSCCAWDPGGWAFSSCGVGFAAARRNCCVFFYVGAVIVLVVLSIFAYLRACAGFVAIARANTILRCYNIFAAAF